MYVHNTYQSIIIAIVAKRLKILHVLVIHKTYYAVQCSTAGSGTGTSTLVAMRRVASAEVISSRYLVPVPGTDWYVHEKLVSQRSLLIFSVTGCIFFAMVWYHTRRKNSRGT